MFPFAALYIAANGRGKLVSRIGACVYALALWLTLMDSGIRGFLYATYRTDYFSGFILDSLANTHESEAREFILSQMGHFLPSSFRRGLDCFDCSVHRHHLDEKFLARTAARFFLVQGLSEN